ncbi:MAG: hypothetical protein P4L71_11860, partial [Acetobacteraceae bacterium]|nr:hypothetical protein [Acetobacteraceae bacterium]
MSQTISGTYAGNVTLTSTPATITETGRISGTSALAFGLAGPSGTSWVLTNQGTVSETGSASVGIRFDASGQVTNTTGAVVYGTQYGAYLTAGGSVVNTGSIGSSQAASTGSGVFLADGGLVSNQSGGTISGYFGVGALNAPATVVNAGVIAGNDTPSNAYGVNLQAGGSVTNQASGTIIGYNQGVRIVGASGTVLNQGTIQSDSNGGSAGIYIGAGGAVTNGASGGTASTAYIHGYGVGVQFGAGGAGTLTNYGTISGLPGHQAVIMATGTVVNGPSGATGALIRGGDQTSAILISGAGTVVNYGTILGTEFVGDSGIYFGVSLGGAGRIANLGTGALISNYVAVYASLNDTVVNAGTIASTYGGGAGLAAVIFGGGTNRLILDPGAVFVGGVSGSGPVTVAPSGNIQVLGTNNGIGSTTLELASGASAGTIAGLGSTITNFASLVFDAGARWTVVGNALASGLGTMAISGFTFGDTIDVTGFQAVSRTFAGNSLVLTNSLAAHVTLAIQGTFVTNNVRLSSDGNGGTDIGLGLFYGQTIDETGTVATSETVSSGLMTLFNAGSTAVGTITVGTSLSTGDFSLRSDGSGGTDVIVTSVFGTYTSAVTLLTNPTTITSTARISGTSSGAIGVIGPTGTPWVLTNLGQISETGTIGYGISFATSGTIINASSGTISAGLSTGHGHSYGIRLAAGGSVTNQSGGSIGGYSGVNALSGALTLVNAGLITANMAAVFGNAIIITAGGGTITNQSGGTIAGCYGIYQRGGTLTVTNAGLINAGDFGVGAAAGTVVNQASIISLGTRAAGYGVGLLGAGTISNLGSTSVIEGFTGVQALSSGTVINAGTIESNRGTIGVAVKFAAGTNRLIVDPGAVFIGQVTAAGTSTLELASGASTGTLTGLGSTITNFASLVFDTGAQWTVRGNDSASGLGTLAIGGFTIGDTIDLTGFQAVSRTFASNALVLTSSGGTHETLAIQGSFATNNLRISSDGSDGTDIGVQLAYAQTLDQAGIVAVSETVSAGVMTLFNAGSTAVGTLAVGSLGTGDFSLTSDGSGGTDVIVHTAGGVYSSGITLSVNPSTIAAGATISDTAASGIGVQGPVGTNWTLANLGIISETGAGSIGVSLATAGTVSNGATGRIGGAQDGVLLANGGLVSAQADGTISGIIGVTIAGGLGTIINAGSIAGNITSGAGISLSAGGTITNVAGGTISGSYGIGAVGVAATVVNAGSIGDGTSLPTGAAIALKKGGSITNQSGGQIIAGLQGIYFGGAVGTLINAGTIAGGPTTGNGVIVASGAVVTNQSGGLIIGKYGVHAVSAPATVVNYGSIGGNMTIAASTGIALGAGGAVTNQSGGTITGLRGITTTGGAVVNAGSIGGNTTTATGMGVQLVSGASLSNALGGTITGFAAVYAKTGATTVVNSGRIGGNTATGSGVRLTAGGAVTNQSAGVITGFDGILTAGGATVENAGSIGGTTAVSFGAGAANRLVVDPGATFTGQVNGGNTIGAAFVSTMELTSAVSAGTLSGLGIQFGNFAQTTIDIGANWTLSGSNSLVAGATLTNSGTLTDAGTLSNAGTIQSNQGTAGTAVDFTGGDARLIDNPGAVFIGAIYGGAGGRAVLELASAASAGTITGLGTSVTNFTSLAFDTGAHWTVAGNDAANGLGTMAISGFASGDTIDLTGFQAVSKTFSNNVLVLTDGGGGHATLAIQGGFSTDNFVIASDGTGGTDITVQAESPPAISGAVAGQTAQDNNWVRPFTGVTVTDPDVGATETVTITLTADGSPTDANGTLLGQDFTKTGTGT